LASQNTTHFAHFSCCHCKIISVVIEKEKSQSSKDLITLAPAEGQAITTHLTFLNLLCMRLHS
jgi:hypothetical protein